MAFLNLCIKDNLWHIKEFEGFLYGVLKAFCCLNSYIVKLLCNSQSCGVCRILLASKLLYHIVGIFKRGILLHRTFSERQYLVDSQAVFPLKTGNFIKSRLNVIKRSSRIGVNFAENGIYLLGNILDLVKKIP